MMILFFLAAKPFYIRLRTALQTYGVSKKARFRFGPLKDTLKCITCVLVNDI